MTPRQARIALAGFALLAGGVVLNALYLQGDASANRRPASETSHRPPQDRARHPAAQPPAKPVARADATKRVAVLKPDSAKADVRLDALPDEASTDTVAKIQRELGQRGFGPVAIDGVMRPVTRAAIMAFEYDNRLPLTGEATEALLPRLMLGVPATTEVAGAREVRSPHAEALIKQVQSMLAGNGYRPGPVNGRLGAETATAIRAFEEDHGLTPRGRISAELVGRLQDSAIKLKAAEAH